MGDSHGNSKKIREDREHSDRGGDYDSDSDSSESGIGAGIKHDGRMSKKRRRDANADERKF